MDITKEFDEKRILIWGYGREGKSSENFLKKYCSPSKVDVFEGKREEINEDDYDLILKSPGIVMKEDSPKYSSQTELFLKAFGKQVIGITGTKGKSTTSAMTAHVLADCTDKKVILLGNIGLPCLDYYGEIDENTIIVFEMSCHQLCHTKISPHIAVFLNLFEEHLDYYETMDAYFAAKSHIATYQTEGDFFFCGENVPLFETKSQKTIIKKSQVVPVKLYIFGDHNQLNATFVRAIAEGIFGCDSQRVSKSMESFSGLPHRLQSVGEYAGINWYDDSISTIPEAAISALESIPNVSTVLIGGMDRGISYDILEEYILNHKEYTFVFMYETGKRVFKETLALSKKKNLGDTIINCIMADDLKDAIIKAREVTEKGRGCVLSPAAASYGYFKNFEERGDVFASLVKEL